VDIEEMEEGSFFLQVSPSLIHTGRTTLADRGGMVGLGPLLRCGIS
jgi:hypothetical protein